MRDTVLVTTATITISNIFFLSQGSSHNNIVKLQSDNITDKKIIFLVLDHLKLMTKSSEFLAESMFKIRIRLYIVQVLYDILIT